MGDPKKEEEQGKVLKPEKPRRVFVSELDDDAVRIEGRDSSKKALFTYLMHGRTLGLHPAYKWQNPGSGPSVYEDLEFLKGDDVEIILGDSGTAEEYIFERMEKLRRGASVIGIKNAELQQYLEFGKEQIRRDCDILDEYLVAAGKVCPIGYSRDKRFRELVREDLKKADLIRHEQHLGTLLWDNAPCLSKSEINGLVDKLLAQTEGKETLSCDSIVAELLKSNYPQAGIVKTNDRLHLLHWKAHEGRELEVPLVNRLDGWLMDPMDPDRFWDMVSVIVGQEKVDQLLALAWGEQFRLARELRESPEWKMFLSNYYTVVDTLAKEGRGLDPEKVRERIAKAYPTVGNARAAVGAVPRWQLAMLVGWLGAAGCGLRTMVVSGPAGYVIGGIVVLGLGGLLAPVDSTKKILTAIKTAIGENAECDKNRLVKELQECLASLKTRPGAHEKTVEKAEGAVEDSQEVRQLREGLLSFSGLLKEGPSDLARNHDHYLHGTPRR